MGEPRDLTVPNVLFLKVHTNGLYRPELPREDEGQPWVLECAAALCNASGVTTNQFCHLIKPEGHRIKDGAAEKHGLSDWALAQVGVPLPRVIGALSDMLRTAVIEHMRVVTYSDFDPRVITAAFSRVAVGLGRPPEHFDRFWSARPLTEFIVLQHPFCQLACKLESEIEGADYRWPTLEEAVAGVLGHELPALPRDAWTDICAIRDLYFHFLRNGQIEAAA